MDIKKTDKLFDHQLIQNRKLRAFKAKNIESYFLLEYAADDLEQRLAMIKKEFQKAISLFNYTDHVCKTLKKSQKVKKIDRIETHQQFLENQKGYILSTESPFLEPESCDLIVSLLTLHEANNLSETFHNIYNALKKDGLFLAAIPGKGTLLELRESLCLAEQEITNIVTPRVMPFIDKNQASILLQQAGFIIPVIDQETITVRYDTLFSLINDLRNMGATNSLVQRKRSATQRNLFDQANKIYAERFSDPDHRIRATFSIIWISGWKK